MQMISQGLALPSMEFDLLFSYMTHNYVNIYIDKKHEGNRGKREEFQLIWATQVLEFPKITRTPLRYYSFLCIPVNNKAARQQSTCGRALLFLSMTRSKLCLIVFDQRFVRKWMVQAQI